MSTTSIVRLSYDIDAKKAEKGTWRAIARKV
jgi:hypothetical protein